MVSTAPVDRDFQLHPAINEDTNDDSVFFPLTAVTNGAPKAIESEMRRRVADELDKAWWEGPPHRELGSCPADPEQAITPNNHA
jgi:hypothetical protein